MSRLLYRFALLGALNCGARTELPVGECRGDCVAGGAGPGEVPACLPQELCNDRDDTCDGEVDERCVDAGCADGTRELFWNAKEFPDIAGCAGAFTEPGLFNVPLGCARRAGNDGAEPEGRGCSAEDLCGFGFRICDSASQITGLIGGGCERVGIPSGQFYAASQSGTGCGECALGDILEPSQCDCTCDPSCQMASWTTTEVFGCGSIGEVTDGCGPLTRFASDDCDELGAGWACRAPDACRLGMHVTKPTSQGGGVLCCRDRIAP